MRTKPMILASMLLCLPGLLYAADYQGRVVAVSDGDTMTVLRPDRTQVKIRLFGVDAPETGQDFGSRAKQATSDLAFGNVVNIAPHDTDRYGLTVAEVRLPDGRSLNHELVRSGLAWWYRRYAPADRELGWLEAEAKAAKRGLWAWAGAVPPWEWRTAKRERGSTKGGAVDNSPLDTGPVVGDQRSHVYHRLDCYKGLLSLSARNQVNFKSIKEAEREGYRKAGDCW